MHAKKASGADSPATDLDFTVFDSPEKELENIRARIRRTLQEDADIESIFREYHGT